MILIFHFLLCTFVGNAFCQEIADVSIISSPGSNLTGDLTIKDISNGIHIQGQIYGLLPGKHGFHILNNDCLKGNAHFNPFAMNHGGPSNYDRHVGDLGNIEAGPDGIAYISIVDSLATLNHLSKAFVGNLSIMVHAGIDDLGLGNSTRSIKTGNAGPKIGCGDIIMRSSVTPSNRQQRIIQANRIYTSEDVKKTRAIVKLVPGAHDISGDLEIKSHDEGVHITGSINGLSPGFHGFHVHQKGSLGNGCVDSGGHFNPFNRNHGSPGDEDRHVGDFGNIFVDAAGIAHINMFDNHASLNPLSPAYIGERAIVVHALEDDLGSGNNEGSLRTGNAGARSGCGRISVVIEPSSNLFNSVNLHTQEKSQSFIKTRAFTTIVPGGSNSVRGDLTFEQHIGGVSITGVIEGLTPGLHGFHVHERGSLDRKCVGAGGHFNPFKRHHGSPTSLSRHVGDLGNIFAENNGIAFIQMFDSIISLDFDAISYIGDRAIVIHAEPDDLGKGRNEGSLKTGNAGSRVACGIIAMETLPGNSDKVGQFVDIDVKPIVFPPVIKSLQEQDGPLIDEDAEFKETAFSNIVPGSSRSVRGRLDVTEELRGVLIKGRIEGLTPGNHGFHVHQIGSLANKCVDAGGHFNPFEKTHGHPKFSERHVGDLGNIYADENGVAQVNFYDDHISLNEKNQSFIGGRAFVIHAKPDDYGRGRNAESLKTGNAGSRVGCGIIVMSNLIDRSSLETKQDYRGMAIFIPGNNKNIEGKLTLIPEYGGVVVRGQIAGLTPGQHGFHIHQSGDLGNACGNARGHFNPFQKNHGSPSEDDRHVGDLGNIKANGTGIAVINFFDNHISLNRESPAFVGERAFVVHALPDDLGNAPNEESIRTGNAGSRDGCANIIVHRTKDIVLPEVDVNNFTPPKYFTTERYFTETDQPPRHMLMPDEQHRSVEDVQVAVTAPTHPTSFVHQTFAGLVYTTPKDIAPNGQVLFEEEKVFVENIHPDAVAVVIPGRTKSVSGFLKLTASEDNTFVKIKGEIEGLSPGYHGFHVHERGQLGNDCSDAGGHFNPFQRLHGAPESNERHVGDLGNIYADMNGLAVIDITDDHISLDPKSPAFIVGKSIVVHANPDDLGRENNAPSRKTGNAGARSGCGLIRQVV